MQDYLDEKIAQLRKPEHALSVSPSRTEIACKRCSSHNHCRFNVEMNIHFPGYQGLDKPTVWVFPETVICMDCGFAEFEVPETELHRLAKGAAA